MERNGDKIIQNKKNSNNQNCPVLCIESRFCDNKKEEEGDQGWERGSKCH